MSILDILDMLWYNWYKWVQWENHYLTFNYENEIVRNITLNKEEKIFDVTISFTIKKDNNKQNRHDSNN